MFEVHYLLHVPYAVLLSQDSFHNVAVSDINRFLS